MAPYKNSVLTTLSNYVLIPSPARKYLTYMKSSDSEVLSKLRNARRKPSFTLSSFVNCLIIYYILIVIHVLLYYYTNNIQKCNFYVSVYLFFQVWKVKQEILMVTTLKYDTTRHTFFFFRLFQ